MALDLGGEPQLARGLLEVIQKFGQVIRNVAVPIEQNPGSAVVQEAM